MLYFLLVTESSEIMWITLPCLGMTKKNGLSFGDLLGWLLSKIYWFAVKPHETIRVFLIILKGQLIPWDKIIFMKSTAVWVVLKKIWNASNMVITIIDNMHCVFNMSLLLYDNNRDTFLVCKSIHPLYNLLHIFCIIMLVT